MFYVTYGYDVFSGEIAQFYTVSIKNFMELLSFGRFVYLI